MSYTPEEIALVNEASAWRRQYNQLRAENEELRSRVQDLARTLEHHKRESRNNV